MHKTLLVTGGGGFVMSNLVRFWLKADAHAHAIVFDSAPLDSLAARFFSSVSDRVTFIQADVLQPQSWQQAAHGRAVTHIVHGAAITPSPEREQLNPREIVEVNIMGTINALDWARTVPTLERFIYTSSGAVYGEARPNTHEAPVPEEGYVMPVDLYGATKFACELITRRYSQLYGLDALSVRFSGVYGPMDRPTPARNRQCLPNLIAHLAISGQTITANAFHAGGDWIHAADVARALVLLLTAPSHRHDVYNIAYGEFKTIGDMIDIVREMIPTVRAIETPEAQAKVVHHPQHRLARWAEYDISRLRDEFGWSPRPLREALQSYMGWIREYESASDPIL